MSNDWKPHIVRVWNARKGTFRWIVASDPPLLGFSVRHKPQHMRLYREAVLHCATLNDRALWV
jgi:hypothetical protein